jgi:hypothetical protein
MSEKYIGGIITANPTAPTTSSASGIWTPEQVDLYVKLGTWPRSPGAPTIGTATTSGLTASVAFTAPSDLGTGALTYTATSSPGSITGTGSSSPITVSGLTNGTSYTFTVKGTTPGGTGPSSAASNSVTPSLPAGSQSYTTYGTYSWVAPTNVFSVSIVAIGGGGSGAGNGSGGSGGGLSYKNNYSVTPGSSYTVKVGCACYSIPYSTFNCVANAYNGSTGRCATIPGGTATGGCGNFTGGVAVKVGGGGGGAAGYTANGGAGATGCGYSITSIGGGGGGTGLFGGSSGGAGGAKSSTGGAGGAGGSGGTSGTAGRLCGSTGIPGQGGHYGGGGGGAVAYAVGGCGSTPGAVRIVWPGCSRQFPSTCVGSP